MLPTVDSAYHSGQASHEAHAVLGPGQLQATDLLPLPRLHIVKLGTGQHLVVPSKPTSHEDPGAALQLYEEAGVVSPGGQHHSNLCPAVGGGVQLIDLVQTLC